jgi:hypothetical protein
MRTIIKLSTAVALLSSPAIADDDLQVLVTPPMFPGNFLVCEAVNVGTTPINLTVEMIDATNGSVIFRNDCSLPPGAGNFGGDLCNITQGAPRAGWCKFTTTFGRTQNLRAAICSVNAGSNGFAAAQACLSANERRKGLEE